MGAQPIISLLYQHGLFKYADTVFTAQALVFYCIGLFAYASVRVIAPVFYAMGDTRTPVKIGVLAVAVNIALNLAFMKPLGFRGLALATSLSAMVNMSALLVLLRRRIGPLDIRDLGGSFARLLGCSALMGAGLYLFQRGWRLNLEIAGLPEKALYVLVLFGVAAGSYALFALILKTREIRLVMGIFKGIKLGGSSR